MMKNELREIYKQKLFQQSTEDRMKNSKFIRNNLFEQPEWQNTSVIGLILSKKFEVDTLEIIKKAWDEGKKVAIPKCIPQGRKMEFYIFTSFEQTEVVYYGLQEPIVEQTEYVQSAQIDTIVVPGLAFSKEGSRLGFGGGYYDRYLSTFHGEILSLVYECQLEENIPMEEHDIVIPKIITEKNVYILTK